MSKKIKILYPKEIQSFNCLGCGDCCKGWGINIDNKTFKKYQKIFNNKIQGLNYPFFFEKNNIHYMKLYEHKCVFLLDNKMCYVHKELGAEYKCHTCNVYPKLEILSRNRFDLSYTFSCPAALQALTNNEPFELIGFSQSIKANGIKIIKLLDELQISIDYYYLIEKEILNFLNNNIEYNIEKKCIIAAFWLRQLYEKINFSKATKTKKIIDTMIAQFDHELKEQEQRTEYVPSPVSAQFRFLITVLNNARVYYKKNKDLSKDPYFKKVEELFDFFDIKFDGSYRISKAVVKYKNLIKKQFYPTFNKNEFLITKYLLYNFFGKRFFLNSDIIRGFNMQLVCYSLIRLISSFDSQKEKNIVNSNHITEAIRFVERYFMHANKIFGFWSNKENETSLNTAPFSKIMLSIP